jgi:hypothetical protein
MRVTPLIPTPHRLLADPKISTRHDKGGPCVKERHCHERVVGQSNLDDSFMRGQQIGNSLPMSPKAEIENVLPIYFSPLASANCDDLAIAIIDWLVVLT